MTYSRDFRNKVLAVKEKENLSMALVAKRFGISLKSVFRWSKNIEAKTTRHKPATKIGPVPHIPQTWRKKQSVFLCPPWDD